MRLHVPPAALAAGRVELAGEPFHHLVHVLRARRGDRVTLFDGAGREAEATVETLGEAGATLCAGEPREVPRPAVDLTLLLGLLKGEKMDLVVQKGTELGMTRLVPLAVAHAVVRLDEARHGGRLARWEKIAREAARQCGRADVPEITPVVAPDEAFRAATGLRLCFHEREPAPLAPLLVGAPPAATLAVGPEGGFSSAEIAAARHTGFHVVSLGPRVLRAETAAIAALAICSHALAPA